MQTYDYPIIKLDSADVLVGGTNTQGRHGMGAALTMKILANAKYGKAMGWLSDQSYGIVTKDLEQTTHPSIKGTFIIAQIKVLYEEARKYPTKRFLIMYRNAPNLNHYSSEDMAYYFAYAFGGKQIPDNIVFERTFLPLVLKQRNSLIF